MMPFCGTVPAANEGMDDDSARPPSPFSLHSRAQTQPTLQVELETKTWQNKIHAFLLFV